LIRWHLAHDKMRRNAKTGPDPAWLPPIAEECHRQSAVIGRQGRVAGR
jgi:hypothetical protein